MSGVYRNYLDPRKGSDPTNEALRLLQVLEQRGRQAADAAHVTYERAVLISFAEYAESFRSMQEFLSFCEVIEGRLEDLDEATRGLVAGEVNGVKMRSYGALLKAMGAYLVWIDKRGMVNYFAQAVFLNQLNALEYFREFELPKLPPEVVTPSILELQAEVESRLKQMIDRSIDVPDFRYEE
ncbi:hypothetical protein [Ferrovibrio sp.]|uniref:hypothetical protein n=1 Tax=Ferrovibrio sp. TaxID=1917215 RepID=UPI0025C5A2B8|nr:hypothetical protein [Ferrovibrio sp.]MBX3456595.1 hypothetical protein [Ferrovibrio sp.]